MGLAAPANPVAVRSGTRRTHRPEIRKKKTIFGLVGSPERAHIQNGGGRDGSEPSRSGGRRLLRPRAGRDGAGATGARRSGGRRRVVAVRRGESRCREPSLNS